MVEGAAPEDAVASRTSLSMVAPPNPCHICEYKQGCPAFDVLEQALYSNAAFRRSDLTLRFLGSETGAATVSLLREIASSWIDDDAATAALPPTVVHASLFDFLMSGLYAQQLPFPLDATVETALVHPLAGQRSEAWFPYLWMCPRCVSESEETSACYLPDPLMKGNRKYARPSLLSRPGGRMIGDLGAIALRVIVEGLASGPAHYAAGGGHRGEFDLVISTAELLILGEIKASPLVAFPVVAKLPVAADGHRWGADLSAATEWSMFIAAGESGQRDIALSKPPKVRSVWPLPDLLQVARDPVRRLQIISAWSRHLEGYRLFNSEPADTRWHRFGCGNIETVEASKRVQLRVDNTKSLPGIDRTDDIKKGIAQVMLFDRLKKGCKARAIKTVLFGNLFAETHHDHYIKPLASVKLQWSGQDPVWLFDAIIALSRNIINDTRVEAFYPLTNTPYQDDTLTLAAFEDGDGDDDEASL